MNVEKLGARVLRPALAAVLTLSACGHGAQSRTPTAQANEKVQASRQLADRDIVAAVESQLYADASVPYDDIEVTSAAGIVSLTGTVTNLLARDHAEALARTVRGVRSVVNRIEVAPRVARTDEQLQKDVEAALAFDPATDSYEVAVDVEAGVATLKGEVDSYAERSLTERVARAVQGIRKVDNAVTVAYRTERPDAEIREEVEARLRWDAYVGEDFIATAVQGGRVELTGKVGSEAERWRAYYDAWVAGTKDVSIHGLAVAPWLEAEEPRSPVQAATESEIERAVTAALRYDPRVRSYKVTPEVDGGTVTLHGTVGNLKAKRAAVQDARATTGVSRVVDRLRVRSSVSDDAATAEDIRGALERDPYVERFDLLVSVHDGVAYLTGSVDSFWEKLRADQIAASANGVERVHNHLTVYDQRSPLVYEPRVYDFHPKDYGWYQYEPAIWMSDAEIRDAIEEQLFWSPYVDVDQVKVNVEGGVATLRGSVDSYAELHAALANAYEGGAAAVKSQLSLE